MSAAPEPPATEPPEAAPAPRRSMLPGSLGDGRYQVTSQLGFGGMGVVVRARDETLGRPVAIKLLADNLALDDGARARFLREARAAAAVGDPRVVAVFDVGEEAGRPYLVMECVDGPSLAKVLADEGPLPAADVRRVATDALVALQRAHEAGLLHRDVKPGNLLRAPDGTIKVTDFGVAVAADGDRLTRTGFVIGTAGYLAPERRRGEAATVRTDLWALGATLTELLTGEAPSDRAREVLAGRTDLDPGLRELLRRLLAERPDDRPRDALAALDILAEDPERSGAPTPPPPARDAATELLPDVRRSAVTSTVDRPTVEDPLRPGAEPHRAGGATPALSGTDDGASAPAPSRWRLVLLAVLLACGLLAIWSLAGSGQQGTAPEDPFGPVLVDPADPVGTVRELAERLRSEGGG